MKKLIEACWVWFPIVKNTNLKSIKQVKNNEFESDDQNDLVNSNSTSGNIGLHEVFIQPRKIQDLVCQFGDTAGSIFRYFDFLQNHLTKKGFLPLRQTKITLFVLTKISTLILVEL
ncbi:hypothetical protein HZS_2023 [Henneguya salminicola]|nr:hypothetical protein HZS_2023 [Henneguya salminicola]